MGTEQHDDGSLDDLFLTLAERCDGKVIDGVQVTRAEIIDLFDGLIATAEIFLRERSGTVRSVLQHVIRSFSDEKLLKHVRDLRSH